MAEAESRKTVKLGDELWVITKDDAPIEWVELICEARQFNGIINLSFLQPIIDAGAAPEGRINVRLRMNVVTAQGLHNLLGTMIEDALKPPNKEKAN